MNFHTIKVEKKQRKEKNWIRRKTTTENQEDISSTTFMS